jgi:Peptidase family S49 N-terminal
MKFNRRILLAVMAAIVLCDPAAFVVDVSAFTMPRSNTAHRQQQQQKQQSTSLSFSGNQPVYHTGGMSSSLSSSTKLSMMMTPSGLASSSYQLASSAISAFSSSVDSVTSAPLFTFFAERVIESAVPAAFSILVIFFFFAQFKGARGDAERDEEEAENTNAVAELYDDLYGSTKGNGIMSSRGRGGFGRGFQPPPLPKNLGLPKKEYIRIRSLNELYSSYDYSVRRATTSKAQAASVFRRQSFDRALNLALNADPGDGTGATTSTLSGAAKAKLLQAERTFLNEGKSLVQDIQSAESDLAELTMNAALSKIIMAENKADTAAATVSSDGTDAVVDAEIVSSVVTTDDSNTTTALAAAVNSTSALTAGGFSKPAFMSKSRFSSQKKKQDELLTKIADYQKKLKQLELTFIEQVISVVGAKRGLGLRSALLGDIAICGTGSLLLQLQDRPLSTLLNAGNDSGKDGVNGSVSGGNKRLFVMNFPGDVQASQLNELREEVTAIVRNSKPGDEALVVLQSGGGTVTGYGLAAGQLVRLKEKGLKLTIAVEQVAASGMYFLLSSFFS